MGVSKPIERLKKKLGVETLWLFILAELRQKEKYPYALTNIIREKYGFNPGKVLPYTVLKTLEGEGYVKSYFDEKRRYYKITEEGKKLFKEGLKYIEDTIRKMKTVR